MGARHSVLLNRKVVNDPKKRARIVQLYRDGMSLEALTARFGPTQHLLVKLLTEEGVTLRTRGQTTALWRDGGMPGERCC
jgi:hypothetical protein